MLLERLGNLILPARSRKLHFLLEEVHIYLHASLQARLHDLLDQALLIGSLPLHLVRFSFFLKLQLVTARPFAFLRKEMLSQPLLPL